MKTIEILFSTAQSEGAYGSRVITCDRWRWRVRQNTIEVHRDGELVAQFDSATVLGIIDLSATPRGRAGDPATDDAAARRADDQDRSSRPAERRGPPTHADRDSREPADNDAGPGPESAATSDASAEDPVGTTEPSDAAAPSRPTAAARADSPGPPSDPSDPTGPSDPSEARGAEDLDEPGDLDDPADLDDLNDPGDLADDDREPPEYRPYTPGTGANPWPTKGRRRGPRPAPLQRPGR